MECFNVYGWLLSAGCKRCAHRTGAIGVVVVILLQVIGKEKQTEHKEQNGELDQNKSLQPSAHGHLAETAHIKITHPAEQTLPEAFGIFCGRRSVAF